MGLGSLDGRLNGWTQPDRTPPPCRPCPLPLQLPQPPPPPPAAAAAADAACGAAQGDHTRRLRKLHAAQKAAAARMLQGAWRRCATHLSPEMRAKRRKQRQKEASRMPTMGGGAATGATYQYGGGGASAGSTAAKLQAEGGDEGVKKLSQKFGGGGVLGKMGSFVMARGKSQDSVLVQGAPAEPAAAAPYLYSGQASAPPSREASPPKGAVSDSSPLLSPPMGPISDIDELSIGRASPPNHKKPGYVPPKQWRPPLQMLLHQHNGRIIAIPHVDVLPAWSTSAPARSSPHEPTRAHTAPEAHLLAQGSPLGPGKVRPCCLGAEERPLNAMACALAPAQRRQVRCLWPSRCTAAMRRPRPLRSRCSSTAA